MTMKTTHRFYAAFALACALLLLICPHARAQTRTVLKTPGSNALLEPLSSGSQAITITTGSYTATAIADDYIASSGSWNGKQDGSAVLTAIAALTPAAGVLTQDGSNNWSYGFAIPDVTGHAGLVLITNGSTVAWGRQSLIVGTGPTVVAGGTDGYNLYINAGNLAARQLTPVANGGTGTASPALVGGSGITISGSWPGQTITVNTVQSISRLSNLTSNGFVKTGSSNGTLSVDTTTYQSTNGTLGLAGFGSITGTLADGNISSATAWNAKESALTFSTGLTRSTNTITVNTSQNIATLSNLTGNGFVKTSGGTGALSIDTATYQSTTGTLALAGFGSITGTLADGNISSASSWNARAVLTANTFTDLQTITQGSANTGVLASTGYSLTGSNATSAISIAGTLNTSGNPDMVSIAGTTTAAGATSSLLRVKGTTTGTTNVFAVLAPSSTTAKACIQIGHGWFAGEYVADTSMWFANSNNPFASAFGITYQGIEVAKGGQIGFGNDTFATASIDTALLRDAAGSLALRSSTSAQAFRVYNTYTSTTSWEAVAIDWQTTSNVAIIGSQKGSGGGSARDVSIVHGNTEKIHVSSGGTAIGSTGTVHSKIKSGVATLVAGVATVSDSDVLETGTAATSSRIIVTRMTDGGTVSDSYSITRINTTSFTITGMTSGLANIADTSAVSWVMFNP